MDKRIQLAWQAGRQGVKAQVTAPIKWFIAIAALCVSLISRRYLLAWCETALVGLLLVVLPAVIWMGKNQSRG